MELSTAVWGGLATRPVSTELVEDSEAWDSLVCRVVGGNILQSFQWGEFKSRAGWSPVRVALYRSGVPVVAAQFLFRSSPIGRIAYVPRGPIVADGEEALLPDFFDEVHRIARRMGAFYLKVEPEWPDRPESVQQISVLGFRPSDPIQPRSTLLLDLRVEEGALAASLNPRTRYNIGLAARRGVEVSVVGENELEEFYRLLEGTSNRSHFPIHSLDYYQSLWKSLAPRGQAHLLTARYQGETLSTVMLLTMGTSAYYMYGGSSTNHRNLKPSDLLQWEAIRWAKKQGCQTYDFWGIPDEVGRQVTARQDAQIDVSTGARADPSRDLWGVYQFKRGFGGQPVRYVGAWDYVYSQNRYWLWHAMLPRVRSLAARVEL